MIFMKKIILQFLLISILAASVSLGTIIIYDQRKDGSQVCKNMCGNSKKCDLAGIIHPSDAQKSKIRGFEESYFLIKNNCKNKISEVRKDLAVELNKEYSDTTKVYLKLKELNAVQSEFNKSSVEHILKLKEIMEPEQRKKFCGIVCDELSR